MPKNFLVTGGAGFIGSNYVHRLLSRGENVTILDTLVRKGSQKNILWLRKLHGENSFQLIQADIRDYDKIRPAFANAEIVIHLAAQVAVTTSVDDPRTDFEVNALGTFNVLESIRNSNKQTPILFASTNKVYGGMDDLNISESDTRYFFSDAQEGVSEERPLDFHSPYGCSKGAADQYVRDYSRMYQIPSVVFRQSCIYGPRQFGVEDQGWVAWFIIALLRGLPLTIYGDGKQVRDLLYIDDLLNAYDSALNNIAKISGEVFNIGGGVSNSISVWKEFSKIIEKQKKPISEPKWQNWRPGDQKVYISNINKAKSRLNWIPSVSVEDGIARLYHWVEENLDLI